MMADEKQEQGKSQGDAGCKQEITKSKESYGTYFLALALGAALFLGYQHHKTHPFMLFRKDVAAGYVDPGKLEFSLEDVERNGTYRSVMRYDNRTYLLAVDYDKRPFVQPYVARVEEQTNKYASATSFRRPQESTSDRQVTPESLSGTWEGGVKLPNECKHETARQTWERLQQR